LIAICFETTRDGTTTRLLNQSCVYCLEKLPSYHANKRMNQNSSVDHQVNNNQIKMAMKVQVHKGQDMLVISH
jgi:hypothetical protein